MNYEVDLGQHTTGDTFNAVFKKYRPGLIALAKRMTFSAEAAEDIVQESFCAFLGSQSRYNGASGVYTYLYRIVINKSIDHQRKNRSRKKLEAAFRSTGNTGRAEVELRLIIEEALNKLASGYRVPLILLEYENQSYEEIARILELSLDNVRIRIYRARQKLLKILKGMGVDGNVLP